MSRHIVTSTKFDLDFFRQRKEARLGPVHVADLLSERLGAKVHQPGDRPTSMLDRIASRLVGTPDHWAMARSVIADTEPGDLIYATGSDCGLPIALLNVAGRHEAKVAIYFVAPARLRPRMLSGLLSRLPGTFLAVTGTKEKVELLEKRLGSRVAGVHLADEQTDTDFFRPIERDPTAPDRGRRNGGPALVVSCGLEQRDYVTLSDAVSALDVDTKICAASPNFTTRTSVATPKELPARTEMRMFEFPELLELYQRADVTVVPLLPNNYSAGLTVLLEALACESPVVITDTSGLASEFIEQDLVLGVPPQDAAALRAAIEQVLADPAGARKRTERARAIVLEQHTSSTYVDALVKALEAFEAS